LGGRGDDVQPHRTRLFGACLIGPQRALPLVSACACRSTRSSFPRSHILASVVPNFATDF
jgi:hypothetical protein